MFRQMMGNSLNLENFVGDAMQWSSSEWKNFTEKWKYRDVCKILPKYRNAIDSILNQNTLDPTKHSIAYSYLLGFKASEKMEDPAFVQMYLKQIRRFIGKADPKQIAIYPRPFTDALRIFVGRYKDDKNFIALIPVLKRCINILNGGGGQKNKNILTFAHCDLMYCCVQSYCYHLAKPEINRDIIQIQGDGCIKSVDYLRYFYYSALVHIGLKDLRKGMEAFVMVLTAPSESLSLMQIDAYKKYILISLIRKQHLVSLPRYTPRLLTRYFPKFCSEYLELTHVFDTNNNSDIKPLLKLSKIIEKNVDVYNKDRNFGLVKQVQLSVEKHSVKKLTSVYTKLSIKKVNELCHFGSDSKAKSIIIAMIKNGDLSASLDAHDVVTFYDGTITSTDKEMLARIQIGIENTLNLWNGLDSAQLKVKQTKEFVEKTLNLPSSGGMDSDIQQQMLFSQMMGGGGGGGFFRHGL